MQFINVSVDSQTPNRPITLVWCRLHGYLTICRTIWSSGLDLNQRSYKQRIYSPSPLTTREPEVILWQPLFSIFSVITGAHTGCLRLSWHFQSNEGKGYNSKPRESLQSCCTKLVGLVRFELTLNGFLVVNISAALIKFAGNLRSPLPLPLGYSPI